MFAIDSAFLKGLDPFLMAAFFIGRSEIVAPDGWSEIGRTGDKLVLQSPDVKQQATITVIQFASDLSHEQFKLLCEIRYKGERQYLKDGFIEPDNPQPFIDHDLRGMFFSGGDKSDGRVFSGYLSLVRQELLTIYVEGYAPPKAFFEYFKAFVKGIRRH